MKDPEDTRTLDLPIPPSRKPTPEGLVLKRTLKVLRADGRMAFSHRINTGAMPIRTPGGGTRFVRFGWKGCSDVLGMTKTGRLLALECKATTKLTADQAKFLDLVRDHGGIAGVVRDPDDATRILDEALGPRREI